MMHIIDRIRRPFRQLRWKMTFSYTIVTVAALLILEIALISLAAYNISQEASTDPLATLERLETTYVPPTSTYLSRIPPDYQGLRNLLSTVSVSDIDQEPIRLGDLSLNVYSTNVFFILFVSSNGTLVDVLPYNFLRQSEIGNSFRTNEIPELQAPLRAALSGITDRDRLYSSANDRYAVGAVPVFDELGKNQVVGALAFVRKTGFWDIITFAGFTRQVVTSLLFITLFAGLLGSVIGSMTARGLVKRLRQLFNSARSWSEGDFNVCVEDPVQDELGLLSTGLNDMASRLGKLLEERQQMSVIQERNRLARELHDSVKQSAFAASAQLGTALVNYPHVGDATHAHLLEVEKLLDSVRQDLTHLIHELRPVSLASKGLAEGIQEYCTDWAKQSGIKIKVEVRGERTLPPDVEHTLFRILQGALSNIARHSKASQAEITLIQDPTSVRLRVADNGIGFNVDENFSGVGMRSLRERVDLLGGTFDIESTIGEGTVITVRCIR